MARQVLDAAPQDVGIDIAYVALVTTAHPNNYAHVVIRVGGWPESDSSRLQASIQKLSPETFTHVLFHTRGNLCMKQ